MDQARAIREQTASFDCADKRACAVPRTRLDLQNRDFSSLECKETVDFELPIGNPAAPHTPADSADNCTVPQEHRANRARAVCAQHAETGSIRIAKRPADCAKC